MPVGQFPAIVAGEILTASLLQSFAPTYAYKATDLSRATFTTLTADPDLSIPTVANAVYEVNGYLNYEGGTIGASDIIIELTSNGTLRYQILSADPSAGVVIGNTFQGSGTKALATNGAGNLRAASLAGTLIAGGTAGSLTLLWAQNTSSATATILHAGSRLAIRRIA
jgi:hypothetical protein